MTVTTGVTGYELVVPADWHKIGLAPELREHLPRPLQQLAAEVHQAGGREFYLSTSVVDGLPLAAALIVALVLLTEEDGITGPQRQVTGVSDTVGVQWTLPVPGGDGLAVQLSFSAPVPELREEFEELFDSVALSLRWLGPEGSDADYS